MQNKRSINRKGMTLIESLVVIGIIALLMAMILPAIQRVREISSRMLCGSNMRQIALACHMHQTDHKYLPWNQYHGRYNNPRGPTDFNGRQFDSRSWSWLARILPYVEHQATYNQGSIPTKSLIDSGVTQTIIKVFLCPSDEAYNAGPQVDNTWYIQSKMLMGLTNYKGCTGSAWSYGFWIYQPVPGVDPLNPLPNGYDSKGFDGTIKGDGIIWDASWQKKLRLEDIKDGTSYTFMFGEDVWFGGDLSNPIKPDHQGGLGSSWAHAAEVNRCCAIPPNARYPDTGKPIDANDVENQFGFKSRHPGGVQFAMAGGSVHFIKDKIDLYVYRALATRSMRERVILPDD